MKKENILGVIMLILFLYSFVKGILNPPEKKPSNVVTIHIEFTVQYKDGFSRINGINIDVPKGTTFKELPGLLKERSLSEHYSIHFVDENGKFSPNIKILINGMLLEDTEKDIVFEQKYNFKFIATVDDKYNDHEL